MPDGIAVFDVNSGKMLLVGTPWTSEIQYGTILCYCRAMNKLEPGKIYIPWHQGEDHAQKA